MQNNFRFFKSLFLELLSKPPYKKQEPHLNSSNPLHILLLSSWSSGSTFLTKLLTHYPGTFLTFEPMVYINGLVLIKVNENGKLTILRYGAVQNKTAARAREIIKDVFKCKYKGGFGEKLLKFLERSGIIIMGN